MAGLAGDRWALDRAVHRHGQRAGHYESFYQRANHPTRPLAFWIRYTIFAPEGRPGDARGELWAVLFDGEHGEHTVGKVDLPLAECGFPRDRFSVRVGTAALGPGYLRGRAGELTWELTYTGDADPLLLLPQRLYSAGFPKAKSLVPLPLARFHGTIRAGNRRVEIDDWVGSQNHNWGSRHTDAYAFGQVAGFDDAPDAFLEVITARTRIAGPLTTPWLTSVVLRVDGREHSAVSPGRVARARGAYRPFDWTFETATDDVTLTGHLTASREDFVALRYANPPGGEKHCLNTKIARAQVTVRDKRTGEARTLRARHRALFEILTDDRDHGVPVRA